LSAVADAGVDEVVDAEVVELSVEDVDEVVVELQSTDVGMNGDNRGDVGASVR